MTEVHKVSVEIGGTEISFETGKMAKQASGAVVVRQGDTMVLSTWSSAPVERYTRPRRGGGSQRSGR